MNLQQRKNSHLAPAVGGQWPEGIPKEPGTMSQCSSPRRHCVPVSTKWGPGGGGGGWDMDQRNQVRKVGGQEQDPAPVNTFLRVTSCTRTRWKWPPAPANKIFRPDALGVAAGPGEHIFARHFLRPDAL